MRQAKKINEQNLDPEFLGKILGYKSEAQKEFVDEVYKKFTEYDEKKQSKSDMAKFFSKLEKIPKENIDEEFVRTLQEHLAHKIDYNDLHDTLAQRICGYENDAQAANSLSKQVQTSLRNAQGMLNAVQTDITNIYKQMATLQKLSRGQNSEEHESEGGMTTEAVQKQIDSLNSKVRVLNETIEQMNSQMGSIPDVSMIKTIQEQIATVSTKVDSIDTSVPEGVSGEVIVLGNGKLMPSRILITGCIINPGDTATTNCVKTINNSSEPMTVFDIYNNIAYIDTREGKGNYAKWMDPLVSQRVMLKGIEYAIIENAFTSWFGNNKFIIDYSSGAFGIINDGDYTEICRTSGSDGSVTKLNATVNSLQYDMNEISKRLVALERKG